jgi:hypothetical protein
MFYMSLKLQIYIITCCTEQVGDSADVTAIAIRCRDAL